MANRKFAYTTHEDELFLRIVKDPRHSGLTKPEFDYVYNGYKEAYATHEKYKDLAPEWHLYYGEKQTWKRYFGKEATLPWTKPEVVQPMGYHMTHTNTLSASGSGPSQPQTKDTSYHMTHTTVSTASGSPPSQPQTKDTKETKVDTPQNQPAASPTVRMTLTPDEVQMVLDYREKKTKKEME